MHQEVHCGSNVLIQTQSKSRRVGIKDSMVKDADIHVRKVTKKYALKLS